MISLRIPQQHYTGFEILLRLEDDGRQELLAALKLIVPTLRKRNLLSQFKDKTPSIPQTDLEKIVATTLSIYNLHERHEESARQIAMALTAAITDSNVIARPDRWEPENLLYFWNNS